jgi:hypothetical protein
MRVKLYLLSLFIALAAAQVFAQSRPYTPRAGTAERQAIMDALRPLVERDLNQEVVFVVDRLKAQNGWAFMIARPRRPDGSPVDFSRTRYRDAYRDGMFSDVVCALLRKQGNQGNRWRVVEYALGPTDVPYVDWPERHGAPRAIFR